VHVCMLVNDVCWDDAARETTLACIHTHTYTTYTYHTLEPCYT
jgi:hypothetical protein